MISIQFVPQSQQRYDTAGDWYFDPAGDLTIKVSNDDPDFSSFDHQVLVALHELVEAMLCLKRGITAEQVDAFDMANPNADEPGDLRKCPYRREHRFAMLVEHLMAHELGIHTYGQVT